MADQPRSFESAKRLLDEYKTKHAAQLTRARQVAKSAMVKTEGAAISAGTGFALGWWTARYPSRTEVLGVDVNVFAAAGAHLAATQYTGESERRLEQAGNAALALAAANLGREIGQKMLAEAKP